MKTHVAIIALKLALALTATACEGSPPATPAAAFLLAPPAAEEGGGFLRASPERRLRFPEDHAPHPGFRTEWWYYTGFLKTPTGERFGFQFTIFKLENEANQAMRIDTPGTGFMLHAALSDPQQERLYTTERIQRLFPGMAGYDPEENQLYVQNNSLTITGNTHRIHYDAAEWSLRLELKPGPDSKPILHGNAGYSPKAKEAGRASHYYSIVDLSGAGQLRRGAAETTVQAEVWMDHEFTSHGLAPDQIGWDWLHLRLEDGRRLMLFQVRSSAGAAFHSGTMIDRGLRSRPIAANRIAFEAVDHWNPADGAGRYPRRWRLQAEECNLETQPWFAAQEFRGAISGMRYWEGAIRARGRCANQPVQGEGYLEMTGYASDMRGRL